ncbi:hypothetical protein BO83DRAFT_381698 [Aspergillus eucalypticola CBS 122712]|uniref:Uncharacterized protein n=1 Tax=Aspergillus eucalypticola (strain CBS 122712 / IBT 29274) TaxID=1448314 RepID=A0A317UTD4_ASPEC|nr:uncharacterized protein BO83DRAFT_381698 [Aspergillus eucalypticola CBS 122712]PWY64895.1 hypothetical protein BO83DRAFT_381698 [Aspergillus eucalypticola CBS 122712]
MYILQTSHECSNSQDNFLQSSHTHTKRITKPKLWLLMMSEIAFMGICNVYMKSIGK